MVSKMFWGLTVTDVSSLDLAIESVPCAMAVCPKTFWDFCLSIISLKMGLGAVYIHLRVEKYSLINPENFLPHHFFYWALPGGTIFSLTKEND